MIPSLLVLCGLCLAGALLYRWAYLDAVSVGKMWERRARAAGWLPQISETQARTLMADLFPSRFARPMGARPREDALSLSTAADVQRLRAWRQRRAVTSRDHLTKHFAEGVTGSEWATEVMHLCVGPLEVEGE